MGIILKIIGFFGGSKGFSIVLVFMVILSAYTTYLKFSNSSLEATNKSLEKTITLKEEKISELANLANENAAKAREIKKDYEYQLQLKEKTHKKQMIKIKTLTVLEERTKSNDKNNDGSIAPILSDTLYGLQQLQADSYKNAKNKDSTTK